jgi:hypothetical protein
MAAAFIPDNEEGNEPFYHIGFNRFSQENLVHEIWFPHGAIPAPTGDGLAHAMPRWYLY